MTCCLAICHEENRCWEENKNIKRIIMTAYGAQPVVQAAVWYPVDHRSFSIIVVFSEKYFYVDMREREIFYLTTHSTHFIYGYMASDIWLRTILIVRKETRCRHICYSFQLTARVLLYTPSHRQDNTYHSLCYTSRGALAGTRNSLMGPPHEGSIRQPIVPWANALTTELHLALLCWYNH